MKFSEMFSSLGEKRAFMPYVCCGDPSVEFTLKLVEKLAESGADAIELGIPFSDPIADGKTIQAASSRALSNGMTPEKAVGVIRAIREKGIEVPVAVMTYYNIVYCNGEERFLKKIKEAGADGLIVPDVPLEESGGLQAACKEAGLDLIYFVTPNCSDARLKEVASRAGGFIYAVSVLGITGAREKVAPEALELIKRAKEVTDVPLVIGFGISTPEHAAEVAGAGASGVIVGSALVDVYSKCAGDEERALREAGEFARKMKEACRRDAQSLKPDIT